MKMVGKEKVLYPVYIKADVPEEYVDASCMEDNEIGCDLAMIVTASAISEDCEDGGVESGVTLLDAQGVRTSVHGCLIMAQVMATHLLSEDGLSTKQELALNSIAEACRVYLESFPGEEPPTTYS